jgi:dynein heavy chain
MDAVGCLSRFKEELKIHQRKFEVYKGGEELFSLPYQEYPLLDKTFYHGII